MPQRLALSLALGLAVAAAPAGAHDPATTPVAASDAPLQAALAAPARAADRDRDAARHPAETLAFFQVRPGMSVVDYMPAGGWYTRVLVPYLGAQGRYIGIAPDPASADNPRFGEYFGKLPGEFTASAKDWKLSGAPISVYGSQDVPDDMKGSVDRVLIFREMHNLLRSGSFYTELTRLRSMLKPDGMLGIVQHRAKDSAPGDYTLGGNGYLRQKDVIALVEAMGYQLVGTSEVNANAADPADHPKGVWELPPTLSTKRDELKPIGESDRMTLLFKKR